MTNFHWPDAVQCPGSDGQVAALPDQQSAICDACKQSVRLGGTPTVPRLVRHNEPAADEQPGAEPVRLADARLRRDLDQMLAILDNAPTPAAAWAEIRRIANGRTQDAIIDREATA